MQDTMVTTYCTSGIFCESNLAASVLMSALFFFPVLVGVFIALGKDKPVLMSVEQYKTW